MRRGWREEMDWKGEVMAERGEWDERLEENGRGEDR